MSWGGVGSLSWLRPDGHDVSLQQLGGAQDTSLPATRLLLRSPLGGPAQKAGAQRAGARALPPPRGNR